MDNLDLNIDNYNLTELLELFNISDKFTEQDMKDAKKKVLKMHPDKSQLDKKFFLFFSKAYKIIYGIYEFRQTSQKNTEYMPLDDNNEEIIKNALQSSSIKKDFNKWFNELFEKTKLEDNFTKTGYDDWLKSNDDIENYEGLTKEQQEKQLEEKKKRLKSLVKYNKIEEMQSSGYNLLREAPDNYSSDIFSSLPFEDLKKAHQESIIPITQKDLMSIENKNLSKLKKDRDEKIILPSLEQAKKIMAERKEIDNKYNTERAFKLLKEDEKNREFANLRLSSMRQISS